MSDTPEKKKPDRKLQGILGVLALACGAYTVFRTYDWFFHLFNLPEDLSSGLKGAFFTGVFLVLTALWYGLLKGFAKCKDRWGVTNFQFAMIMLTFSFAGSSILYVKKPLFQLLHLPMDLTPWLKIPMFIVVYYILLLFWGTILGQFRFFWEKEKRMVRFLLRPFLGKPVKKPGA